MAVAGKLRVANFLKRRAECGSPCQLCSRRCPIGAIEPSGRIRMDECFYCLDCQVVYHDKHVCPPLVRARRRGRRNSAAPSPSARPAVRGRRESAPPAEPAPCRRRPSRPGSRSCPWRRGPRLARKLSTARIAVELLEGNTVFGFDPRTGNEFTMFHSSHGRVRAELRNVNGRGPTDPTAAGG